MQKEFQGEDSPNTTKGQFLCEFFLGRFATLSLPLNLFIWKHWVPIYFLCFIASLAREEETAHKMGTGILMEEDTEKFCVGLADLQNKIVTLCQACFSMHAKMGVLLQFCLNNRNSLL